MRDVSRTAYGGALVLTAIAGYIDALAFILTGGLFVSFMSGNSTQAGVELIDGRAGTAMIAISLVASFVAGVTVGRLVDLRFSQLTMSGRLFGFALGLSVAMLTTVLAPDVLASVIPLAFMMGAMNTLFVADGRARVALTYATGTLVTCGLSLAERIAGDRSSDWRRPLLLWVAIAAGAVAGAICWGAVGLWAFWIAPAVLLLLASAQGARRWRITRASE